MILKGDLMGGFKRFGDFCAAFGAFAAFMYLFRQYMGYNFKEIEGIVEKLKFFLSDQPTKEYRFIFGLFLSFLIAFVISCAFHKLPFIALGASALPLAMTVIMFDGGYIYERPMVFVIMSVTHLSACLFECIRRDRYDRGRRASIGLDILGLMSSAFCGYVLSISKEIEMLDLPSANIIESTLYYAITRLEADISFLKYFAVALCISVVVSLILRDIYYVDAAIAIVLAVFVVYKWSLGEISVFGSALCALAVAYAIGRIAVMLTCRSKYAEKVRIT